MDIQKVRRNKKFVVVKRKVKGNMMKKIKIIIYFSH